MNLLGTTGLTKLIQLIKSNFISTADTVQTSEVTLATVATTGDYSDLTGAPTVYHPDLLTFQWSDHILNDVSWLRADTFSWQDGTVYEAAYDHLFDDIDGVTPTTETIGSYTITVYVASDGHKIVLADQASTVENIYSESGVAWYFILDTANQRFKLPRTKFGFTGLRDSVGKYVPESLPNITGKVSQYDDGTSLSQSVSGAFYAEQDTGISGGYSGWVTGTNYKEKFDASRSSSTYQDNAPVQQRTTQMYLYFYVGDYTQTAIEQTAGLNTELFNNKLDRDMSNMSASQTAKETIVGWGMPDYDSGYSVASTAPNGYAYWIQAPTDGIVMIEDSYNQDYVIRVSKTGSVNGTGESTGPESTLPADQITISHHVDAFNGTGTGSSFAFVPKNYYFSLSGYSGNTGKFFPLKGEVNA